MKVLSARVPECARRRPDTTTASRLYALAPSGTVTDSPGLQAFGLAHVPTDRLAAAFPEFAPLIGSCHFANCRQQTEPGCAVRAAFDRGEVDPRRMRIFDTLLAEGGYTARRALHGG